MREVYVFAEGEVTEEEYAEIVREHGARGTPGLDVNCEFRTPRERKPMPMVEDAIDLARQVRRAARKAKLKEHDERWPQVWCLFDCDQHKLVPEAMALAKRENIGVAYSHPCFEFWRLLHYQNYTSTFATVCNSARDKLRGQDGFAKTYGPTFTRVDDNLVKHVRSGQLLGKYKQAKKYAKQINEQHHHPDPCKWDPYTGMWMFVEEALDITDY
ncbi:RloB family protein [Streptomyces axinellae]|uniref:RloB family protein n=1 Tax=Streptomyces axinellae TaxID=552788 RepID=UPI0031D11EA0